MNKQLTDHPTKFFENKLKAIKLAAERKELTEEKIQAFLKILGPKVTREEFLAGVEVEKEHGPSGPKNGIFDVTNGNMLITAKIAAAHLAELPDYYTRLKKMEEEGERYWGETDEQ